MHNETSLTQQVVDAFQFAFPQAKITLEYPIYVESNLRRYPDIGIEIDHRIILVEVKSRSYNFDNSRDREELKQIEMRYLRFLENVNRNRYDGLIFLALPNVPKPLGKLETHAHFLENLNIIYQEDLKSSSLRAKVFQSQSGFRELPAFQAEYSFTSTHGKKYDIFISYRRLDSIWAAGRIYDALKKFIADEDKVFLDSNTLNAGDVFKQEIENRIKNSSILLAIIGSNWLKASDQDSGQRRLDNRKDLVRGEIALALQENLKVIPVLLDDCQMPSEKYLPKPLKDLAELNAFPLRAVTFEQDMIALEKQIKKALIS